MMYMNQMVQYFSDNWNLDMCRSKLSLKDAKINFFENLFLQQVTFIYDCNIMQKKVGVTGGRVTSSGLPPLWWE